MIPGISVIVTVKDEQNSIALLLESLLAQSWVPDEIVIVDGGSSDATVEIIQEFVARGAPIKLLSAPGANISEGRNLAIETAEGKIIAVTDAGVRLSPFWLQKLLEGFGVTSASSCANCLASDVVSGFFLPDPRTVFEVAMGATVLPTADEIDSNKFLPSSRSIAFTKDAWRRVGGYPEWLDYCEDLVFDLKLRAAGCRFTFVPEAVVYFRPRENLRRFFKQYYLYARGDGKADLWPKRHAVRYATYILAPIALTLGFWYKLIWLLVLAAAFAYLLRPYRRLWPYLGKLQPHQRIQAMLWVPIIRLTGDVAKMVGYPVGVWWRLRKRDPTA